MLGSGSVSNDYGSETLPGPWIWTYLTLTNARKEKFGLPRIYRIRLKIELTLAESGRLVVRVWLLSPPPPPPLLVAAKPLLPPAWTRLMPAKKLWLLEQLSRLPHFLSARRLVRDTHRHTAPRNWNKKKTMSKWILLIGRIRACAILETTVYCGKKYYGAPCAREQYLHELQKRGEPCEFICALLGLKHSTIYFSGKLWLFLIFFFHCN